MKKFTKDNRLQALSHMAITDELAAAAKLVRRVYRYQGKPGLAVGTLLNALVVDFLGQPEKERRRTGSLALARLELFLADTDEERAEVRERLGSLARQAEEGRESPPGGVGVIAVEAGGEAPELPRGRPKKAKARRA